MTDAPERIWATGNGETGSWNAIEGRMKSHMPDGWQTEYVRADLEATASPSIATPLDDPRVLALVEAAREVKADCIARADKHGVVPIGRGAWDQLTAALSALEESK